MKLIDISKGNIKRRPGRAFAVAIGLMIAVAAMIALFALTTGLAQTVEEEMAAAGTKVLILPQADKVSFSYGGMAVASGVTYNFQPLPKDITDKVKQSVSEEQIVAMSPVNLSALVINNKQYLAVKQDFAQIDKLKPWWKLDGNYPKVPGEVILGSSVAQKINVKIGAQIATEQGTLTVKGILKETGAQDDNLIFTVNDNKEAPSLVEIILKNDDKFEGEITKLKNDLTFAKVSAVRDASEAKKQSLEQYKRFSTVIALIMALVAVLIVSSGFSAAATERAKEVGIFRAMGFHIKHIINIFLYEALILAAIGSIVGIILGQSIAVALASKVAGNAAFLPWYSYAMVIMGTALLAGLSAYFPAKKAAMVDPAEALRYL